MTTDRDLHLVMTKRYGGAETWRITQRQRQHRRIRARVITVAGLLVMLTVVILGMARMGWF